MRELGEKLKAAREEKGLSLEQIQNNTKIRLRYLQALEDGDFGLIPGEVYVRGFLQNYASMVGIEPRDLLAQYDRLRTGGDPGAAGAAAAPQEELRTEAGKRRSWAWWQPVSVGGAILVLALLVFIGQGLERNRAPVGTGAKPPVKAERPAKRPPAAAGVELTLRFIARCWLSVRCDGLTVFTGTLGPGEIRTWRAKDLIVVQFGNAGGVMAELNGKDQGILGRTGESLTLEFR